MYTPAPFGETRPDVLQRIVQAHPLDMLVTQRTSGLEADHLPFLFDAGRGPHGTLMAHVARANPVCTDVRDGDAVLVVFRGVDGYISPNWYPARRRRIGTCRPGTTRSCMRMAASA